VVSVDLTACCPKIQPKQISENSPEHSPHHTRTCVKLFSMDPLPPPFAFLLLLFSGWVNRQQQLIIDYLREETAFCAQRTVRNGFASPMTSDDVWQ
jgi:hypothetical protein